MTLAVHQPSACVNTYRHTRVERVPVCSILVTELPIGHSKLQLIDRRNIEERFTSQIPSHRDRGEKVPSLIIQETGAAVVPGVHFQQVTLLVVVVKSAENSCGCPEIGRAHV